MEQEQLKFPGFPEKPKENYWQYPEIMNGFWHALSPIEQKVLDYILRHTWGWHKNFDYITYNQMKNGVPNCDLGTGIKSNTTLSRALKGLEQKNMIKITSGKTRGIPNMYSLVLIGGSQEMNTPTLKGGQGGSIKRGHTIDNTIDNKTIDNIAIQRIADNINPLIELFKFINPTYERLFANKTQRASLERLVAKFGEEKVKQMIEYLPKIFGKLYAPRITTPYQLEQKMADLIAYAKSEKDKKPKIIEIRK